MQVRIDKAKLYLIHSGWPGLVMECKQIIDDWELPDIIIQEHKLSKALWKVIINSS